MKLSGGTLAVAAAVTLSGLSSWKATLLRAQGTQSQGIQSISVCSPAGSAGKGSCPSGSLDTQQLVLGSNGKSINSSNGFAPVPDQHSSVFAPGALATNQNYLFFLATGSAGHADIGVTVLS